MAEILLVTDLLEIRARKLKELEYYSEQLEELKLKMAYIQKEIQLTSQIIDIINRESLINTGLHIKKTI